MFPFCHFKFCVSFLWVHSAHVLLWGLAWHLSMLIRNIQHALSVYANMVFKNRCKQFSGSRTRKESDVEVSKDLSQKQIYKGKLILIMVNEAHCYSGFPSVASTQTQTQKSPIALPPLHHMYKHTLNTYPCTERTRQRWLLDQTVAGCASAPDHGLVRVLVLTVRQTGLDVWVGRRKSLNLFLSLDRFICPLVFS